MIESKTATAAVPLHLGDRFAQKKKKNAALALRSYWVLIDSEFPNTPSI